MYLCPDFNTVANFSIALGSGLESNCFPILPWFPSIIFSTQKLLSLFMLELLIKVYEPCLNTFNYCHLSISLGDLLHRANMFSTEIQLTLAD